MIADLHDAIAELLKNDTEFVSDIGALGLGSNGQPATPKVLRAFRPVRSIGQEHFPCWAFEPGDDSTTGRAIGSCHQELEVEILVALVWHREDPDAAYYQRLRLREALTRLFLRNPSPDGESTVYVDAQGNDRSANHPTHITTFRLIADVTINK